MNRSALKTTLAALALVLATSLSLGAQDDDAIPPPKPKSKKSLVHPKPKPPVPQGDRVDLNSASKEQLMKLKGITADYAAKIIAARPYKTKIKLITANILPRTVYDPIRHQIAAVQPGVPQPPKRK